MRIVVLQGRIWSVTEEWFIEMRISKRFFDYLSESKIIEADIDGWNGDRRDLRGCLGLWSKTVGTDGQKQDRFTSRVGRGGKGV